MNAVQLDRTTRRVRAAPAMPKDRRARILTAALVLLVSAAAVGLRAWKLDATGFNSDEAVYAGQAAGIAGQGELAPYFPVFRAHPMLFQTILSLPYHLGVSDLSGRLVSVAFGLSTVALGWRLGVLLYGRRAGVIAALFLALMPYHVVVTRQVLLDGPMTFFATVTLYLVARCADSGRREWLWAAGPAAGLMFLTKETSIVFLGSIYAFVALAPQVRARLRDLAVSSALFVLVASLYPLSMLLAGKSSTGMQFLVWQLFRRPNHSWHFYLTTVPQAMGLLVVAAALAGLWLLRGRRSWRETLLLAWIAVPFAFFQLWPVKGFQYLVPLAVPVALLAARAIASVPALPGRAPWERRGWTPAGLAGLVALSLLAGAWGRIQPSSDGRFLAGSGGVPGGREVGRWVDAHIPEGAQMLALGPSMANILQFYGHRKVYGLSVSPNPLRRNPVYEAIENPDLMLRTNGLHYLVWDSFSASRSPFFANRLNRYVDRYHGREVHRQSVTVRADDGRVTTRPLIIVYEVRP